MDLPKPTTLPSPKAGERTYPLADYGGPPPEGANVFDGSREQFAVGKSTKVSEFLAAIPLIKGDPIAISAITNSVSAPDST
jgi:hypothetical protein